MLSCHAWNMCHAFGIARRLAFEEAAGRAPLDEHAAMRADVEEGAHFIVRPAACGQSARVRSTSHENCEHSVVLTRDKVESKP